MKYKFKFRRRLFFRSIIVVGHGFNQNLDRMMLYLPDGGIREIHEWSKCDCKLGIDWVLAKQKDMEEKSAQSIAINRDLARC